MATYKVIQDIEAEDHLLGPLTLKGFIYAIIAVFLGFINYKLVTSPQLGAARWVMLIIFALPMILFIVLASPLGRQQPTEVWLLARVRFFLKPRKKVWSQSGMQHTVRITAPKVIEKQRTKGFSDNEVKSRLETLATTLDSRGWAVKNVTYAPTTIDDQSDRLVAPTTLSSPASDEDIKPADDILDEQNNPTAQYFEGLMEESETRRKLDVVNRLTKAREEVSQATTKPTKKTDKKPAPNPVTAPAQADKLELAQSGNDFSVATLSKLANRDGHFQQLGPNEGLLTLH